MKIADLFVNLGIKGDNKAIKSISAVQTGLVQVSTAALEAKAAILAMMYGLERLTAASNAQGTSLVQFNALTGLSIEGLQKLQYAGAQMGASYDEVQQSVESLQQKIYDMTKGKGTPEGLQMLAKFADMTHVDLKDTYGIFMKLQELMRAKAPPGWINSFVESFGMSRNVMAGMREGVFNEKNFANAPIISDRAAHALQKMDAGWGNFFRKFKMEAAKLNLEFGGALLKDLNGIAPKLIEMIDSFAKLITQTHALKALGMVFEGWGLIFDRITVGAKLLNKLGADDSNKPDPKKPWWDLNAQVKGAWTQGIDYFWNTAFTGKWANGLSKSSKEQILINKANTPQQIILNQNFFDSNLDPTKVGRAAEGGVTKAIDNQITNSNKIQQRGGG